MNYCSHTSPRLNNFFSLPRLARDVVLVVVTVTLKQEKKQTISEMSIIYQGTGQCDAVIHSVSHTIWRQLAFILLYSSLYLNSETLNWDYWEHKLLQTISSVAVYYLCFCCLLLGRSCFTWKQLPADSENSEIPEEIKLIFRAERNCRPGWSYVVLTS